jgi:hypothetical protein
MSRLRYRGEIFRGGIGDDAATPAPAPVPAAVDSTVLERLEVIRKAIEEQNRARKYALMIAGASALFAAVKLGIIAFPHIKSRIGS